MEKVTLKLAEFYQLSAELEGVVNNQTGEVLAEGLISSTKNLVTKYWLTELGKKVTEEKNAVEKIKEDLIKKHGEAGEDGSIGIPMYINIVKNDDGEIISKDINPKFVEFQNEFNELLQETKELEHKEFKLADFNKTDAEGRYDVFFKLVKAE